MRLAVILNKTRFPENIGMAARACANMGCERLILSAPERWDYLKAEPLATPKGVPLLKTIAIYDKLEDALAPFNYVIGTTARSGGFRRQPLAPDQAAREAAKVEGEVALLFGPEDRGLTNRELRFCQRLVHIPANPAANSLNLAQAVLIMLYEFRKSGREMPACQKPRGIGIRERILLEDNFKSALIGLDCLRADNPDYFFQIWQGMLNRIRPTREEFDALMGFCRQLKNMAAAAHAGQSGAGDKRA